MTDRVFLSEIDLEILYALARGLDDDGMTQKIGLSTGRLTKRIFNLQSVFGANTRAQLVAIAIASNVIYVPDLYDETLAEGTLITVHRRKPDGLQGWNPASLRVEIQESVMNDGNK